MTDFSTVNDNNNISSININSHFEHYSPPPPSSSTQYTTKTNPHSQPHLHHNYNSRLTAHRQSLPTGGVKQYNNSNTAAYSTKTLASVSGPGSAPQSPQQHYRIPLNSPNNSLFTLGKRYQQQQLNDRLLQQQHLQYCQQQQLLQSLGDEELQSNADAVDELSEESLKQNVAIVLSNLDRYNSALRSIILNEQVSNSLLLCDGDDSFHLDEADNNNFLLQATTATKAMAATNMAAVATPESDYNSNATTPGAARNNEQQQQHGWFLDYGYRDGCGGMQRSVLSSLSASYNAMGDLIYYDDLAKNLDANLAEVDMESFRAEDIHSLLSQLPAYCKSLGGANSRLQQSLLYQQQQQQQQQQQLQMHMQHSNNMMIMSNMQHMALNNMSQTSTTSTNELIDNSFCKSELLFSPVKESHISVDSLDMDAYPDEGDIILTCNKDNYTIAFEGSVLYSDDSFYEPCEIAVRNKQNCINLHSNLEDIVKRNKALEVSMSRSAQSMQFLCKSPKNHQTKAQLQRYPSGNNNNGNGNANANCNTETIILTRHLPQCSVRKSNSLPNLQSELCESSRQEQQQQQEQEQSDEKNQSGPLNVSQAISTSTMESCSSRSRNLLPMCQMPISISEEQQQQLQIDEQHKESSSATTTPTPHQQQQSHHHHHHHHRHKHRCGCGLSSTQASQNFCSAASPQAHISGSASSGNSNPAAFNLVKLFIKQKSSSSGSGSSSCAQDENQACALTCMDVSSGCWPSSSCSSSSLEKRLRKKSMNDSGKGSAVSRHDEDEEEENDEAEPDVELTPKRQLRSRCDAVFYDDGASSSSTGSLTATNSPAHRRRSMPLRNPQLYQLAAIQSHQTQTQQSSDASSSEQVTQVHQRRNAAVGSTRPLSCASSSEMITRSMQTSCGSLSTTHSSLSERYRCVPPSFLAKLHNLGEQREAPIYVIYPNYALPDLGFVKTSSSTNDVIFTPFNYKMTLESAGGAASSKQQQQQQRSSSSQSVNEHELFKTLDYKHIADWQSLATLLPAEYRRRLQHIPEVKKITGQLDAELSQKPLFCMTPPIRRNRSHICDCAKNFQQQQQQTQLDEASSSGSSQPPSSGYRGSSTLLTDSEVDPADPLKQMYVYQYDQQQQQRMDSGVETSPASRPQPMPRSILRKAKRNSMIEASKQSHHLSKLEKRRSLQEPPYNYALGSTDELAEVFEEEEHAAAATATTTPPTKQRLSRKDLDARARAENFLASLPRSELKYYAEIAAILESSGEQVLYDAAALKKEVSRVLSQQKKVSFNDAAAAAAAAETERAKRFSTPPNSPNISIATLQRRETLDVQEQRKIESNRFKRLQIQWELMSKDSSMLKELANEQATQSGGSTPTSTNSTGTSGSATKSRIPRPVSYPAGRVSNSGQNATNNGKGSTRSPSRLVPPKRYSLATTPTTPATPTAGRARTPTNRAASAGTAGTTPNTPKRHSAAPSSRPTSRVR